MSSVSNNYQADYTGAISMAATGGTAWGLGQYVFNKRPFIDKNQNIQDTFIKKMEDALVEIKDSAALENVEYQKNIEKEIDALSGKEALQKFVKDRKGELTRIGEENITTLNDELARMEEQEGKSFLKKIFESNGKYNKFYQETLEACYDEKGKLVHQESKLSKESFEALKKVIRKERARSALVSGVIFTGICALSGCLLDFFLSRKSNKSDN